MSSTRYKLRPSEMTKEEFVSRYGGVYEHSPWIAEQAWENGLDAIHDSVEGLSEIMREVVEGADEKSQLGLIRAHPDLAGKAAVRGELTRESSSEQASAGIDQCSNEEFDRFQHYNRSYKKKFQFPFVMAVRDSNRTAILEAFEQRLENDYETEFARALVEIHKIAGLRLQEMVNGR